MKKKEVAEKSWFCKKHGLAGNVGKDWCFGCYTFDEDTETPTPYIQEKCPVCGSLDHKWCGRPAKGWTAIK